MRPRCTVNIMPYPAGLRPHSKWADAAPGIVPPSLSGWSMSRLRRHCCACDRWRSGHKAGHPSGSGWSATGVEAPAAPCGWKHLDEVQGPLLHLHVRRLLQGGGLAVVEVGCAGLLGGMFEGAAGAQLHRLHLPRGARLAYGARGGGRS